MNDTTAIRAAAAANLSDRFVMNLTPDDADALHRVMLGHHVCGLEIQKARVFAEQLRAYVIEQMNGPAPYEERFDHGSEILGAEEVQRFLDAGDCYRIPVTPKARSA